jgi:hypothetical protein
MCLIPITHQIIITNKWLMKLTAIHIKSRLQVIKKIRSLGGGMKASVIKKITYKTV